MLTLLLLRHAKAGTHGGGDDFARALTAAGVDDARRLGVYVADIGLLPTTALVSTAVRTTETFALASSRWPGRRDCSHEDLLYNASAAEIIGRIRQEGAGAKTLLVVGHNPGIAEAAVVLSADGDPAERERMRRRYPPCGLAILSFDADEWRDACACGGRLDLFLTPEDFPLDG